MNLKYGAEVDDGVDSGEKHEGWHALTAVSHKKSPYSLSSSL